LPARRARRTIAGVYGPPVPQQTFGNAPYRARTEVSGAPIASGLRWAFLVFAALGTLFMFGAAAAIVVAGVTAKPGAPPDDALFVVFGIGLGLAVLFLYVQIFLGIGWVYRVWSWLPETERYTKHWKGWITPQAAALFLLIPYFHYYWMFVINTGICDAMDRLRVARPTSLAAPKNLAIAACVCQLVVPVPVGTILWFMFMSRVERMSREMAAAPVPHMPIA
jgi:hypothetical protein